MSLSSQSSRLLTLIASLSTAGNVRADVQTLAARASMELEEVRSVVSTLVADGLATRELSGAAPGPGVEYRLTFAGWDIVDDMAAVDPRADLDAKQRAYSQAAAAVSQFPDHSCGGSPGARLADDDFAATVEAEELAKHRYDRALDRYLQHQRQPVAAR